MNDPPLSSQSEKDVSDHDLIAVIKETLLNLDTLEGEVNLVKRRLSEHLDGYDLF